MTIDQGAYPVLQEAALTREEENIIKARLFSLLTKQVRLRTQGDHSSLREEDAAELLDSLQFTLRYQLYVQGMPMHALLTADLNTLLRQGQEALQTCVEDAHKLYTEALHSVQTFGSRSLKETLAGIGQFFRAYDLCLYAHSIPADIDYQLCLPVGDGLRGVLYIRDYLTRLLTENKLVIRFASDRVAALLHRSSPDYRDLLVNLYDPVSANALGLMLLKGELQTLRITPVQAAKVYKRLVSLPSAAALACLREAADAVCDTLKLTDPFSNTYIRQVSETLYPRLIVSPQSACGVFSAVP
ncbi:MAG TPA: DUF6179 domain-containing protein [Candidatus Limiplasma sp.]|nr:DUF6179 domain-containing protein [Candidatus Limiplasma sp.]